MQLPKVTEIPPKRERVDPDAFVTETHQLWPTSDTADAGDSRSKPEPQK